MYNDSEDGSSSSLLESPACKATVPQQRAQYPADGAQEKLDKNMTPITPKQFLEQTHAQAWKEIHWTITPTPDMLYGFTVYPVGFPNSKGEIVPFALWLVKES